MPEKPKLYMLCGLPGSGKTTFARKFAEDYGYQYLGPDSFYALFNGYETLHIHKFEIWMAVYRALHMAEQDGRSVVFDTNAPTVVDRSQILDWFPGFEPHLIYIEASESLCLQNNNARRRVIPTEEMERLIRSFTVPCVSEDRRWKSMTFFVNNDNKGYRQFFSTIPGGM